VSTNIDFFTLTIFITFRLINKKALINYKIIENKQKKMSNIRDLQKLKNTRFIQPLSFTPNRQMNPESNHFSYEPLSIQMNFPGKNAKNGAYGKESLRSTGSKIMHKRGASFGTA